MFIPTTLKTTAQTVLILKRGKAPFGERAHFNIKSDDVIIQAKMQLNSTNKNNLKPGNKILTSKL